MKKRFLSMLVLLMTVATGAWADTTVTWTASDLEETDLFIDFEAGLAGHNTIKGITVTASSGGNGVWQANNINMEGGSTTITFTSSVGNIKSIVLKAQSIYSYGSTPSGWTLPDYTKLSWSGDASPTVSMTLSDWTEIYNISEIVFTIESAPAPAATGYKITLDEGTGNKDSQNWEITPKSSELSGGEAVTVKYNGSREVKSVTVVKKGAVNPNAYMKWDADQKKLVATPMPESFTTVTSEVTEWSAGTYVVEGQVDINRTIELSGDVNLIIKDGAKLTVYHLYGNSHNLSIFGQASQSGQLDVGNSGGDAINEIPTLEVHSAKVTATSSESYGAGFGAIGTFNVYGGSVDAKGTHAEGGCGICLGENGSMNIYGGEVKAEGKGIDLDSYGITCAESLATTVKVYGGKLWAGCADNKALDSHITLAKGGGFSGKIETSNDDKSWEEYDREIFMSDSKYVRVGY